MLSQLIMKFAARS